MMPLCSILLTASAGAVYFLIVLSTCSAEECGLQITEKMRGRSVVFRNVDMTFCQTECVEDFFMFASCHRSRDGSKRTQVRSLNHPSPCPFGNCKSNTSCVEKRRDGALCVNGHTVSSTLEMRCSINSDCPVTFVCFTNTCKCVPGYSFNPANNSCVRRCKTYGDGFTTYQGLNIRGHNDRKAKATSAKECSKMCITEKTFTCITYERDEFGSCDLSHVGYLDVYPLFREVDSRQWNLSMRHCS